MVVAFVPPTLTMIETGTGDPQLVAGQISESLVSSMLLLFIDIPLAILIFWGFKKYKNRD